MERLHTRFKECLDSPVLWHIMAVMLAYTVIVDRAQWLMDHLAHGDRCNEMCAAALAERRSPSREIGKISTHSCYPPGQGKLPCLQYLRKLVGYGALW